MPRFVIICLSLATLLTACAPDPRNTGCAPASPSTLRWGYYPGYGCGPVPPAQTVFS